MIGRTQKDGGGFIGDALVDDLQGEGADGRSEWGDAVDDRR
jgi:hypothetical protein